MGFKSGKTERDRPPASVQVTPRIQTSWLLITFFQYSQECARRLRPTFEERRVRGWQPQPSEVCAGGVPGEDTCRGEGGAPLVCYEDSSDQYFLVGLVGYGFDCNTTLPGVYTNMADPTVQRFVNSAIGNDQFCK